MDRSSSVLPAITSHHSQPLEWQASHQQVSMWATENYTTFQIVQMFFIAQSTLEESWNSTVGLVNCLSALSAKSIMPMIMY